MKKIISVFLICFLLMSFGMSSNIFANDKSPYVISDSASNNLEEATDDEVDFIKKKTCSATLNDDFVNDTVLVAIDHKNSINLKDYSTKDFEEISTKSVYDLTKYETSAIKKEYSNEVKEQKKKSYNDETIKRLVINKIEEKHKKFCKILRLKLNNAGKQNVLNAIKCLEKRNDVVIAEPDYFFKMCATPNDPYYNNQLLAGNIQQSLAWNETTGSSNVVVGVLDTGIDSSHEDLHDNIDYEKSTSFVDNSPFVDSCNHGTNVAGVIGAVGNNQKGIAGMCWNIKLASIKIKKDNKAVVSNIIDAIDYATQNNIEILNLSFSFYDNDSTLMDISLDSFETNKGILICSAGNEGINIDNSSSGQLHPSKYTNKRIFSVAAIDNQNNLSIWNSTESSNYGKTSVDLAAPGTNVYTTKRNGGYESVGGTSLAAPYVTGTAALIKSLYPTMSYNGIRLALLNGVDSVSSLSNKVASGGKLNAYKAIESAKNQKYTIKYNKNNNNVSGDPMNDTTIRYGVAQKVRKNSFVHPEENIGFAGWYAKRASDNKWLYKKGLTQKWCVEGSQPTGYTKYLYSDEAEVAHSSTVKNDVITMYAQWRNIKYTIKYHPGVSTDPSVMPDQQITYGVYQNLYANIYNCSRHHFIGWFAYRRSDNKWLYNNGVYEKWYTESNQPEGYEKKLYPNQASVGKTTKVYGDIVDFYAQWDINTYSINYNANGGVGSMPPTIGRTCQAVLLSNNLFTNPGYVFLGWNASDSYNCWSTESGWSEEYSLYNRKVLYITGDSIYYDADEGDTVTMTAQWANASTTIGDVNLDGVISINDATQINKYILRLLDFTNEQYYAADVNGDSQIDNNDVVVLQEIIANQI